MKKKKLNTLFGASQIGQIDSLSGVFSKSAVARVAMQIGLEQLEEIKKKDEVEFYKTTAKYCLVID